MRYGVLTLTLLVMTAQGQAEEKNLPATRWQMKEALEALKKRTPRLPLPPLTDEEKEKARLKSKDNKLGGGVVNNGRMRQLYLPAELRGGDFSREKDPAMTLDYDFKTMLFWIVSRVNNCHY